MRNLCSSIVSRKFPTMGLSLGIRKKKPKKRTTINKKLRDNLFVKKVLPYLQSNYYMFHTLASPQPIYDSPPVPKESPGVEEELEPAIEGRDGRLIDKVVDYLKVDCYLYAPLITDTQLCSRRDIAATSTVPGQSLEGSRTEETRGDEAEHREKEGKAREDRNAGVRTRAKAKVVMRTVAYHEAVKHIVHQNCRSSSVQGSIETRPRNLVVE